MPQMAGGREGGGTSMLSVICLRGNLSCLGEISDFLRGTSRRLVPPQEPCPGGSLRELQVMRDAFVASQRDHLGFSPTLPEVTLQGSDLIPI